MTKREANKIACGFAADVLSDYLYTGLVWDSMKPWYGAEEDVVSEEVAKVEDRIEQIVLSLKRRAR